MWTEKKKKERLNQKNKKKEREALENRKKGEKSTDQEKKKRGTGEKKRGLKQKEDWNREGTLKLVEAEGDSSAFIFFL